MSVFARSGKQPGRVQPRLSSRRLGRGVGGFRGLHAAVGPLSHRIRGGASLSRRGSWPSGDTRVETRGAGGDRPQNHGDGARTLPGRTKGDARCLRGGDRSGVGLRLDAGGSGRAWGDRGSGGLPRTNFWRGTVRRRRCRDRCSLSPRIWGRNCRVNLEARWARRFPSSVFFCRVFCWWGACCHFGVPFPGFHPRPERLPE